jgi:hypothetical protein
MSLLSYFGKQKRKANEDDRPSKTSENVPISNDENENAPISITMEDEPPAKRTATEPRPSTSTPTAGAGPATKPRPKGESDGKHRVTGFDRKWLKTYKWLEYREEEG